VYVSSPEAFCTKGMEIPKDCFPIRYSFEEKKAQAKPLTSEDQTEAKTEEKRQQKAGPKRKGRDEPTKGVANVAAGLSEATKRKRPPMQVKRTLKRANKEYVGLGNAKLEKFGMQKIMIGSTDSQKERMAEIAKDLRSAQRCLSNVSAKRVQEVLLKRAALVAEIKGEPEVAPEKSEVLFRMCVRRAHKELMESMHRQFDSLHDQMEDGLHGEDAIHATAASVTGSKATGQSAKRGAEDSEQTECAGPEPPKRPLGGYGQFVKEQRDEISAALLAEGVEKGQLFKAVAKKAGESWKALGEEKQKPYNQRAEKLIVEYKKDLVAFNEDNPKYKKHKKGQARKLPKKEQAEKPPSRPVGPYPMWIADNRTMLLEKVMKERGISKTQAFLKLYHHVRPDYDALSEEDKKTCNEKAEAAKVKYQEQRMEWKSRQKAEGR
jgi:hypothetical protein